MSRTKKPGVNVVRDGIGRPRRLFPTQRKAIDYGRPIARRDETGLRIQDRQGC